MEICKKIVHFCDGLNEWIGSYLVTAAVFVFVGTVFSNVIMRYVFNTSFVFMAELEWHLFAFVFLIGAGYTLLHNRHVRVDIFYSIMSPKMRAFVNCVGVLIFLLPSCYLVLNTSIPWVKVAYDIGEVSIDPGGIPFRFLLKAVLPVGYFLVLLQGVSLFLKNAFVLLDRPLDHSS
jgi:TRAP-type mannitol/chloroaromatic compound transport system permease small subunit